MPPSIPASASADLAAVVPASGVRLRQGDVSARLGRIGIVLVGVTVIGAVLAPLLGTVDPAALTGSALAAPSGRHLMGTDALGRDLYSAVLYGARTSLWIGVAATLLALAVGLAMGLASGYARPTVDDVAMRATEIVQVLPRFLVVIVVVGLFGAGAEVLILTIGFTSWPSLARAVRAEVRSLRELDFVRAAVATGAPPWRVLRRELLPNVMPVALTMAGVLFGQVLLLEASLGFLGASDPNAVSWGMLAGQSHGYMRVAWWLAVFPGLAIATAVLGVNLMVDGWFRSMGGR